MYRREEAFLNELSDFFDIRVEHADLSEGVFVLTATRRTPVVTTITHPGTGVAVAGKT
jgi:hypothetical protein